MLEKDIYPQIGTTPINRLQRGDVAQAIDRIIERGSPFSANATQVVLSRLLNWAVERDYLEQNPIAGLRKRGKYKPRDRHLTIQEIEVFFKSLRAHGYSMPHGQMYSLQLLTAARPGEVVRAEWNEFDIPGLVWNIPSQRTKNGLAHQIPLSSQTLAVLESIESKGASRFLFPSPFRAGALSQYNSAAVIRRILARPALQLEPFTPHDLRRTAATLLARSGVDRETLRRILNHKDTSVTAIYDKYRREQPTRDAINELGRILQEAIGQGREASVPQ